MILNGLFPRRGYGKLWNLPMDRERIYGDHHTGKSLHPGLKSGVSVNSPPPLRFAELASANEESPLHFDLQGGDLFGWGFKTFVSLRDILRVLVCLFFEIFL